jgi:hypothetical protein
VYWGEEGIWINIGRRFESIFTHGIADNISQKVRVSKRFSTDNGLIILLEQDYGSKRFNAEVSSAGLSLKKGDAPSQQEK